MGAGKSKMVECSDQAGSNRLEDVLKASNDLAGLRCTFNGLKVAVSSSTIPTMALEEHLALVPTESKDAPVATWGDLATYYNWIGTGLVKHVSEGRPEITWEEFLQGVITCCKEGSGAARLKLLLLLYSKVPTLQSGTGQHSEEAAATEGERGSENELEGFSEEHLQRFLLTCWVMSAFAYRASGGAPPRRGSEVVHPAEVPNMRAWEFIDVAPLVQGAMAACRGAADKDAPDEKSGGRSALLTKDQVTTWALGAVPGLSESLSKFVRARLVGPSGGQTSGQSAGSLKEDKEESFEGDVDEEKKKAMAEYQASSSPADEDAGITEKPGLLTRGVSWMIGLSERDGAARLLLSGGCSPIESSYSPPHLLYRASLHGRGVNRFFARVEGYRGPVLLLLLCSTSASSQDMPSGEAAVEGEQWVVGCMVPKGFDNKGAFYGLSGGCLLAVRPEFKPLRSTGRESNYVYSHVKVPGQGYRATQQPQGVGFGGSVGKERLWLDDEFEKVTVRHHAVDKSYQHGDLVPHQGYAPVVGQVHEVEVWGLGGADAEVQMTTYQKREELFAEQRRKIDLKKFAGDWESSPDKMMLDMLSDANKPQREER
eukprot:jgi/Mesen1/8878/ME000530S08278